MRIDPNFLYASGKENCRILLKEPVAQRAILTIVRPQQGRRAPSVLRLRIPFGLDALDKAPRPIECKEWTDSVFYCRVVASTGMYAPVLKVAHARAVVDSSDHEFVIKANSLPIIVIRDNFDASQVQRSG
jgi:hypothetical protein